MCEDAMVNLFSGFEYRAGSWDAKPSACAEQ
jgi:hypothetical protein